jgi:glycosyltransferase involved in cell wall biosynthesis
MVQNRPRIVHANTTKAALAALFGVALMRPKLIWHVRDITNRSGILRLCSVFSYRIIAISWFVQKQLVTQGIPVEKIQVVTNSVVVDHTNLSHPHTGKDRVFTFANIGQFVPWKKQMLFVDAAEAYLQKDRSAKFLIIGGDVFGRDKTYEQMLKKRVAQSLFSESFQIIPWQENLNGVWPMIDCLVHTADTEPFGRVIIEAMERKVPVIAADAFGPSEILDDCITGFLFEPDDIHELVCCMEMVAQHPQQMTEVVSGGYEYVCQNHNSQAMAKQLQAVYS